MAKSQEYCSESISQNNHQDILSAQHSAQLCQACGICCNGTLFSYVDITQKEAQTLKSTPLKIYPNKKGKPSFGQSCRALSGTSCSIYDKRPYVCRTYLCALTRNVLNGRTDLKSALDIVSDMKTKSAWLLKNLPTDMLRKQTDLPGKKQYSVESVLALWQINKNEKQKSDSPEMSEPPKALWSFLNKLHRSFAEKQGKAELTAKDKEYIASAFAFAKLCDRLFERTALLRKYAELIQRF